MSKNLVYMPENIAERCREEKVIPIITENEVGGLQVGKIEYTTTQLSEDIQNLNSQNKKIFDENLMSQTDVCKDNDTENKWQDSRDKRAKNRIVGYKLWELFRRRFGIDNAGINKFVRRSGYVLIGSIFEFVQKHPNLEFVLLADYGDGHFAISLQALNGEWKNGLFIVPIKLLFHSHGTFNKLALQKLSSTSVLLRYVCHVVG